MRGLTVLGVAAALVLAGCKQAPEAQDNNSAATSAAPVSSTDGFFGVDVKPDTGAVMVTLPSPGEDGVSLRMIYTARLVAGLGSNPVGLDRGWGDSGRILVFRQVGNKLVAEIENMTYRASPNNPLEQRAVKESFARSFLWATDIQSDDGGLTVDLSGFLKRDALNITKVLSDRGQGNFSVASDRTLVDADNVLSFPDNIEIDVFLTLTSKNPGREVTTTAADGNNVTLIQHHSFVRLPEDGYTPLPSDPRAGAIEEVHYDYSAALDEPIEKRLARRYRLEKTNPDAARSTVKKPIVFYIDSGAPEPVRSALIDGARWWEEAFEAAGYDGAYRVEILPEDAHPLDVRYNVVQWVHRQTRGWSYGGGVSDPRTGEMLKGHVNLGSLRVRQDRMIFEGLAGTAKTGTGEPDDPIELALARIRQLSAHEVGHALGFAHNFAASTYDFGSVMDYPAPNVTVKNGEMDFTNTYGVGVGPWDNFAATWLYGDMSPDQREALIDNAHKRGLLYVADSDARGVGTAHPEGNIWDNGPDPVAGLQEALKVRALALSRLGKDSLTAGEPVANLNKVVVPIYLYHRYQVAAAGKYIGGVRFNYSLNGDGRADMQPVATADQRRALSAILDTLDPKALDMPDRLLNQLTPNLVSYSIADSTRELFSRTAYPVFDVSAAADTAADLTFDVLLNPRRAARLIELKRRDSSALGFSDLLDATQSRIMSFPVGGREGEIAKAVQMRFAFALMQLIDSDAPSNVKAKASYALAQLDFALTRRSEHGQWIRQEIERFLNRPAAMAATAVPAKPLPPGGPIGGSTDEAPQEGLRMGQYETCWHCE